MIQVRESYQIKFGRIDQAVSHWMRLGKEQPATAAGIELLTDLSGDMFNLVVARHLESVDSWERAMAEMAADAAYQAWFKPVSQLISNGHREYLRLEQPNQGWSEPGVVVVRSCFRALEWRVPEALELLRAYGAMLVDQGVGGRPRILSEFSGHLFNVMIEVETRDLKDWDEHRRTMFRDPQFQVWFQRLTACVSHGSNAFFNVAGLSR
jgi:hypothetical protein